MNLKKRSKIIKIALIALIIFFFLSWIIQHASKNKGQTLALPTVAIQKPRIKNTRNYVSQTGTVVAYNSVNLVARIKGYLETVEFTDGSFIKKGKALFVIEPLPYLEQLKGAEATVVARKAAHLYAKAEYGRQQRMYKQNATSLNNVEKWSAKTIESQAQIDEAVANAEIAAINYSYTHVLAPFDGRIGRHLIDPGNLVGNGVATNLATIEQIDPIYVYFNLNELDLIKIRQSIHNNSLCPAQLSQVPVYVKMQNASKFSHAGKLNFVNTGLNASTGTMGFRALLANKDYSLLPGLFVQVRIPVSKASPQLTIPDSAIQYDQIGAYVLTVDQGHYVKVKRVTLGALEQETRAILTGLDVQDQVIVAGIQNATPGSQVKVLAKGNEQE